MSGELAPGEREVTGLVDVKEGRETDLKPTVEVLESLANMELREACQTALKWAINIPGRRAQVPGSAWWGWTAGQAGRRGS